MMHDEDVLLVLKGLVAETPELGETPRRMVLEYLDRTASRAIECMRAGEPIHGGPLRGTRMVVWEGPREVLEAFMRDAYAYRALMRTMP